MAAAPQFEFRSEQIISQFLLKSLHVILDSRIPSHSGGGGDRDPNSASINLARKSDKWFHLALGDRPAALENLSFWHRSVMDPMTIDIILVHDKSSSSTADDLLYDHTTSSGSGSGRAPAETVIERWVVQYEIPPRMTMVPQQSSGPATFKTYKKSIILLRSLYSTMRLLPAYKIFRKLSSTNQSCNFDIIYKVSSFSEPFTRAEESSMKQFSFKPVEAHPGRLCVSVTFRPTLSDLNLQLSTLVLPHIITDYVGSPAADPLKIFPSGEKGARAISFPSRGIQSPSSTAFQRPHSWTSGLHRATTYAQNYSLVGSPPGYYRTSSTLDYSPSPPEICGNKFQGYRMPNDKKGVSVDEYQPSPPFSSSPSPSPPTYFPTGSPLQTRLYSGSSPVNIPSPIMNKNYRYLSPSSSDPSRTSLPPLSPRSTKPDLSSQESPSTNRSVRKIDSLRSGEFSTGTTGLNLYSGYKVQKDSKDDSGHFSGLVSSSGSPRIGFSRSSSRLSFQDDLDDCEFSCPFAVDDVDSSDSQPRVVDGKESYESGSQTMNRKSQDAAIGVLVHMLRTAPPLRQDHSCYSPQSNKTEAEGGFGTASSIFLPRKTADALDELRSYKEIKELLLSRSGTQAAGNNQAKPTAFIG
ncbi:hypothetical protein Sjap_005852 [Stephania japonica]|uniref:Autophagy-related protein 13 N-terminal domain-containing protein n=1 Tax=Stephania japonica TaxID=461633 RepID=A0AAP0K6C2_9MAGN